MMFPEVVLVSLLSLVLVYSAAGLECRIYVSSSDGINNTSCWTGGVQTPCATIDLAIQGTAALQYNCSSGILINLSPGTYTLDTTSLLEQQVLRNNVSIIGMRDGSRYEEVSINCLHVSSSSYNWLRYIVFECVSLYNCNNVPVTCTEPSFDITTHNEPVPGNEDCPNLTNTNAINTCDINNPPYKLPCIKNAFSGCCTDKSTGEDYLGCSSEWGVPVNIPYICTECDEYGLLVFIAIEILPITIMVLLIIIFNIQLTNGSINGVVFYSQIIAISYSIYSYHFYNRIDYYDYDYYYFYSLLKIPCNIFNLDFTPFMFDYAMCISPNTPPLGVISFWYVIGFYPLLLLLLLYVWITLYDKGYKCVVFITRPFHRCMARFWSMTGIEPSFTHSIASIYILCFTQLAATSFKILSFNANSTSSINNTKFYYDIKQGYFDVKHGAAGFFAILVLLFLIVLPTLYILLYPFKLFHEVLDCLHLRKQLLISLGDVFTGPYKNGTENTYDYRFMAGLYLLARIIILSQFLYGYYFIFSIPISQACCSFLLAVIVIIFRPFQRNIHNFIEFLIIFISIAFGCAISVASFHFFYLYLYTMLANIVFNGLVFIIIIPGYIIYQVYKMIKSCHRYHRRNNPVANRNQEEDYQPLVGNDDDWIADRMENPQEYDEQHVHGRIYEYDGHPKQQQPIDPITIATAATYGSCSETTM